jgi:hypothetical protein
VRSADVDGNDESDDVDADADVAGDDDADVDGEDGGAS